MEENNFDKNTGLVVLNLTLICLVFSFGFMIYKFKSNQNIVVENIIKENKRVVLDKNKIKAKAVIVYDVNSGDILYGKNINDILPLASLVKIMTAYTARNLSDPDTVVSVSKSDLSEEGDSGLLVGESWKLKDILDFSLVVSSNDASKMVANSIGALSLGKDNPEDLFIKKMNDISAQEGLNTLIFNNETGLDKGDSVGGQGSAKDVAKLVSLSLKKYPDIFEKTSFPNSQISSLYKVHRASNTNDYVSQISGVVGSKTGFTDRAGGNLMTVFNVGLNRQIVTVVLGSTLNGRFEDMVYITKETIDQLSD